PTEQPSWLMPQESCLIHNWQEEGDTNHPDPVPGQWPGSEGFAHWHSHQGLWASQLLSWPTDSTTMKDAHRPSQRPLMLQQGEAEFPLLTHIPPKKTEMLEKISPPRMPMESVSTTHRDYCARGCQFTPLPTTQPHNYCTEQPCTFWLEQARSLPGVTSICSGGSPFRRNAAFSTPITEYLGQPLPCAPLSSQLWSHKQ
ncbi:SPAG8 protein, partial [Corythaixoides concolor]|nr:SPAG8 protein [Corythaixoides concolor]